MIVILIKDYEIHPGNIKKKGLALDVTTGKAESLIKAKIARKARRKKSVEQKDWRKFKDNPEAEKEFKQKTK